MSGIDFVQIKENSSLDISVFGENAKGSVDCNNDGLEDESSLTGVYESWTYENESGLLTNGLLSLNVGVGIHNVDAGLFTFTGLPAV